MKNKVLNWILSILTLTPARALVIVLMPFIAIGSFNFLSLRIDWRVWILTLLFLISSLSGLVAQTTTIYSILLSCIIFLPVLFLLFSTPTVLKSKPMKYVAPTFIMILLIVDALGLYFWLKYGGDEYGTAYGTHYEYAHGLGMINTYVLLWYVMKFFYGEMKVRDWLIASFIALSWLGCQYGLGLVCLIFTFIVLLLTARKFKILLFVSLILTGAYFLLQTSRFTYERENIMKLTHRTDARKLIMFDRFFSLLREDSQVLMIGTGAGGYNSRAAQLLSGENHNMLNRYFGKIESKYYKQDIYPLWNRLFVSQRKYNDGTRNKPYSSAVSICAENGIIFFLLFCWMYADRIRYILNYKKDRVAYNYILALDIFMIISLISHMWLETSEFVVYCLIRHVVISDMQYRMLVNHLRLQS